MSGRLAPFNTARGFSGKDAERSNRSLCPIKRREARVASPHKHRARSAVTQYLENTHICPRRRVVPYRGERRVFRLSLAALPSDLGKREDIVSPSCPGGRRAKMLSAIVHSLLRRSPHEDVEHVVGSSGASRDREREQSRSSFARRPSISMQQHRERARKARHRKSRRQRRVNGNY